MYINVIVSLVYIPVDLETRKFVNAVKTKMSNKYGATFNNTQILQKALVELCIKEGFRNE